MWVDRRNNVDTRVATALYLNRYFNTTIKNVTVIGGAGYVAGDNVQIENWRYATTPFVPTGTSFPTKYRSPMLRIYGSGTKAIGGELIDHTLPPYYVLEYNNLLGANNEAYEFNIVCNNTYNWAAGYFLRTYSDNTTIKNCVCNLPNGSILMEVDALGLIMDNVRGFGTRNSSIRRGARLNMVATNITSSLPKGTPMYVNQDALGNADEGFISWVFGPPLTPNAYEFSYTGATSYYNNSNYVYLESGASVTFSNRDPLKGVTAFRNADYLEGQNLDQSTEMTWDVEMVNAGQEFTGDFTTIVFDSSKNVYSGMQALLDALPNYNSDKGFNMRVRITNDLTSLQYLNYFAIPINIDTTYTAKDAYVTIEGGTEFDQYEMRKKSDTSVLFSWTGVGRFDFYVGNIIGEEVYFVRYILSDGTYDRAASNKPFPITLQYGDNGAVKLYVGDEVQVGSSDPATIWNYGSRTLTEGTYTEEDRAKALTTGKFLALK